MEWIFSFFIKKVCYSLLNSVRVGVVGNLRYIGSAFLCNKLYVFITIIVDDIAIRFDFVYKNLKLLNVVFKGGKNIDVIPGNTTQ